MEPVFAYEYRMSACLRITDEDAADFLQSQFSNDLRPFDRGQITYGLWLDKKGKVCADSYVLCESDEAFYLLSEYCGIDLIKEKLERHIIADDVAVEVVETSPCLALVGNSVPEFLARQGFEVPKEKSYLEKDGLIIFRGRRADLPNFELVSISSRAAQILENIRKNNDVETVGGEWIHLQRILAQSVLIPNEIGPTDLPGEGGLVPGVVSLDKGCFLGQEVVARMHNLGRPLRALYKVSGASEIPHVPQKLFNSDNKPVGELRSAYKDDSGWFGTALLKIRHVEKVQSIFYLEDRSEIMCSALFNQK
ncbi:MAG: hypothetical protein AAGH40_08020 [Verrucomicrobiota bacterium]